jgi:hypothetical protein
MRYIRPANEPYPALGKPLEDAPAPVSFADPEHALRATGRVISEALWRLDSARSQLRWAKADGHSLPALDAAVARITEAESLVARLCVQYTVAIALTEG